MMKRAAIYLRVSKGEQETDNQRPDVKRMARSRGLRVVAEYVEKISAVRARTKFDAMMRDAHEGRFDVLLIWALDRFGRSMIGNMQAVLELDRRGVEVVSVREPWLDTGGAVRPLLIAIFSWVAEQERAQVVARTKGGLERARRRGIRLGRPARRVDVRLARELETEGASLRTIARRLKVPTTTLHRAMRRSEKGSPKMRSRSRCPSRPPS